MGADQHMVYPPGLCDGEITMTAWIAGCDRQAVPVASVGLSGDLFDGHLEQGYHPLGGEVDALLPSQVASAVNRMMLTVSRNLYPAGTHAKCPTEPNGVLGGWVRHCTASSLTWWQLRYEILMSAYVTCGVGGDVIRDPRVEGDAWVWAMTVGWDFRAFELGGESRSPVSTPCPVRL